MKKIFLFQAVFLFFLSITVYGQEKNQQESIDSSGFIYGPGDRVFSINLGICPALFFIDMNGKFYSAASLEFPKDISGSLIFDFYLQKDIKLGFELSGGLLYHYNESWLSMVPVVMNFSYDFCYGPFTMPLRIGAGVNFSMFRAYTKIDPILKPGTGIYYSLNSEWALGVSASYWFIPQFYFGEDFSKSMFGNFYDLSLSVLYHY